MAQVTHDCYGLMEWLTSWQLTTLLEWHMTAMVSQNDCDQLTTWLEWHMTATVSQNDCDKLTKWLEWHIWLPWSHRMTVTSSPHGLSDTWLSPSNRMTDQLTAHHMAWVAQDCHSLTEQLWPAHHMAGMTRQHWNWARILDDLCRRHLKDHLACAALAAFIYDWVYVCNARHSCKWQRASKHA